MDDIGIVFLVYMSTFRTIIAIVFYIFQPYCKSYSLFYSNRSIYMLYSSYILESYGVHKRKKFLRTRIFSDFLTYIAI